MAESWIGASEGLRREKYINLETFKRDGSGVKTPVWFAHEAGRTDGALVFMTDGRSWKCKRLGRNDQVKLAACDVRGGVHGEWIRARCHKIEDPGEVRAAAKTLAKKYHVVWHTLSVMSRIGRRFPHRAYYRIVGPDEG